MIVYKNGKKYDSMKMHNVTLHTAYDYERHGLINRLISSSIYNTDNNITRMMIDVVEKNFIFVMKYIDILMNFTNIYNKNR